MRVRVILIIGSLIGCMACATTSGYKHKPDMGKLADLKSLNRNDSLSRQRKLGRKNIRTKGLREIALRIGAQGGLSWKAKQYDAMLEKNHRQLDQVFNFHALLLEHHVLPPVLEEAKHSVATEHEGTVLRVSDHTYRIVKQARFATTVPNWRTFLWLDFKKPQMPDASILPRTGEEKLIWRRYVALGWAEGIKQANKIYRDNLAEIERDYRGMVLYRKLLAQKMVSKPYVAKTELGVTGGGDNMSINDQVLRISALPALQADSQTWDPAVARQ